MQGLIGWFLQRLPVVKTPSASLPATRWWPRLPDNPGDWELTSTFLSRPAAALLLYPVRAQASPNAITTLALAAGVAGALALLFPEGRPWAFALLFLAMLLDDGDGQLARYQGRSGTLGSFWDKSVDVVRFGLLFPILGVLAYRESGSVAAAMAGPMAAFGLMVQGYTKWLAAVSLPPASGNTPAGNAAAPPGSRRAARLQGLAVALLWPFHECDLTLWVCILGILDRFTALVWVLAISQLAAGAASLAARLIQVYRAQRQ